MPACTGRTVPFEGACVPVGPRPEDCASGFSFDAAGGACAPILPPESCKSGEMAVPGDVSCRPVATCGTARFPVVSGAGAYVDASAAADGADGTEAHPFLTIGDAVRKSTATTIAVAAGRYEELVELTNGRTLVGVCPSKVTIVAPSGAPWAVSMQWAGTLSNVAVTGEAIGVSACEGRIALDHVWIHDTANRGLEIAVCPTETALELTDSLIERARDQGVIGMLGTALVKRSVIRDTKTTKPEKGVGVWWQWDKRAKGAQTLTVDGSVVERNLTAGIYVASVPVVVDATVARSNRPLSTARNGRGLLAGTLLGGPAEKAVVRRSYFADNTGEAISVGEIELELESTAVVGTRLEASGAGGGGLVVREGARAIATKLALYDNGATGIALTGGELTLRDSFVRDDGRLAIIAQPFLSAMDPFVASRLELERVLIERAVFGGLVVIGMPGRARGLLVRDVRPNEAGLYGDGIAVTFDPGNSERGVSAATLDLEDVYIEKVARAGIGLFGGDVTIRRSRMLCNRIDVNVESTGGLGGERPPSLTDGGDVACGCATLGPCRAASAGLAPLRL